VIELVEPTGRIVNAVSEFFALSESVNAVASPVPSPQKWFASAGMRIAFTFLQ
jgi:hypothetical protein